MGIKRRHKVCLTKIDVVDQLSGYSKEDEAGEDPSHKRVSQVAVLCYHVIGLDVAKAKDVELLLTASSCRIDWEQDRPGDTTAHETDHDGEFAVPQEEVAIERVVLKDVFIWDLLHEGDPSKECIWSRWCSLLLPYRSKVCSRGILPREPAPQYDE